MSKKVKGFEWAVWPDDTWCEIGELPVYRELFGDDYLLATTEHNNPCMVPSYRYLRQQLYAQGEMRDKPLPHGVVTLIGVVAIVLISIGFILMVVQNV